MKLIFNMESEYGMKPKPSEFKSYLRKIRLYLLSKEVACPEEMTLVLYFKKELAEEMMEEIRSHIALCDYCIERVKQLARAAKVTEVGAFMTPEMIEEDWKKFKGHIKSERKFWQQPKMIWRMAAAIIISVIVGLAGGLYLTRPDYYYIAQINKRVELKNLSIFRGTDLLSHGIYALKERNFDQALRFFLNFLKENPDSFAGHYYLGLTYVLKSQSGLFGIFRFRQFYVEKAVTHLNFALQYIEENERLAENCYWFLGKAYLMQGKLDIAKLQFQKILLLPGRNIKRKKEAETILKEIEKLEM